MKLDVVVVDDPDHIADVVVLKVGDKKEGEE
jgi:hypothetical protein